jgi:hypothetical protein
MGFQNFQQSTNKVFHCHLLFPPWHFPPFKASVLFGGAWQNSTVFSVLKTSFGAHCMIGAIF